MATIDQLNYDSGIQIQNYTSVIDYFATTEGTAFAASYSTDIVEKIKRALIFHRQLRLFLSAVHEQLVASREALQSVNEKYEAAIRDLKQACRSKSAVPVDQVYPHFMNLATVWTSYRDTLFLLALRQGILETLDYFVRESDRRYSVPVEILASIEASRARGVVTLRSVDPEPKLDADIVKTGITGAMRIAYIGC